MAATKSLLGLGELPQKALSPWTPFSWMPNLSRMRDGQLRYDREAQSNHYVSRLNISAQCAVNESCVCQGEHSAFLFFLSHLSFLEASLITLPVASPES